MKRLILLLFVGVLLGPFVQAQDDPFEELGDDIQQFLDWYEFGKKLPGMYQNNRRCVAQGYTEEQCAAITAYCAYMEIPGGGGPFTGIAANVGLNQLFKINCGDDQCFQCCHVPGAGCHSSFVGLPVINCNERYGAGTNDAGLTLLLDPKPGEACLFTPQTCEHIAKCAVGNGDKNITDLNNDPEHPMKLERAVQQRGRVFAEDLRNKLLVFLDTLNTNTHSLKDVADALTGRGCEGWSERYPFDWSDEIFRVEDPETGEYLEGPSQLNGLAYIGILRILNAIPNIYERLAFVESQIWTEESTAAYLAKVGDADAVLRDLMSPIIVDILKTTNKLQDYRLLAVPLDDEAPVDNLYNGCFLGQPPMVFTSPEINGAQVTVNLDIRDALPDPDGTGLLIVWGDGTSEKHQVQPGFDLTFSHTYATGGKYPLYTVVENSAGLRSVSAIVVEPTGPTSAQKRQAELIPTVSKVRFINAVGKMELLTGNACTTQFQVDLYTENGDGYESGLSRVVRLSINEEGSFGDIVAHNEVAAQIRRISIMPNLECAYLLGLRQMYLAADKLELSVISTETGDLVPFEFDIKPEMIRLYTAEATEPDTLAEPTFDENNRLQIPYWNREGRYERIEIELDETMLRSMLLGPVSDPDWKGINATYSERRPGSFDKFVSGVPIESDVPQRPFTVGQAFPNPARGASKVEYTLNKDQQIRIEVVNLLGQRIALLADDRQQAGAHEVTFDPDILLSKGVYFYRVSGEDFVQTRSLIYLGIFE